jgi:fibronectin-binding autotransporter adhesin
MTLRNWLGNTGTWSDPTQWGGAVVPGTADIANFGGTGTYEVTFTTTDTLVSFGGGSSTATVDITSGLLDLTGVGGNSSWGGLLTQSGGSLVLQSGTLLVNGVLNETGGSETIGLGARLNLNNGATIDSQLAGAGALGVGGIVTLDNNAIVTIGAIAMATTGTLVLGANQSYAGAYVPAFGSLVLGGHQIIMFGHDNFGNSRIVGPGTIAVDGSADLPATSMVGTGGTLFDAGTITVDGNFALGASTTDRDSLTIDPGAVFDILTDTPISSDNAGSVASGTFSTTGSLRRPPVFSARSPTNRRRSPTTARCASRWGRCC